MALCVFCATVYLLNKKASVVQIKSNMTLIMVDKLQPSYKLQLVKRDKVTVNKRRRMLNRNVNK